MKGDYVKTTKHSKAYLLWEDYKVKLPRMGQYVNQPNHHRVPAG